MPSSYIFSSSAKKVCFLQKSHEASSYEAMPEAGRLTVLQFKYFHLFKDYKFKKD